MLAEKLIHPAPSEQEGDVAHLPVQQQQEEDVEDEVEVLSFCDLPIYSDDSADWSGRLVGDHRQTSPPDQDLFEFSSEQFSTTSCVHPSASSSENIIFCGKIIPCKFPPLLVTQHAIEPHSQNKNDHRSIVTGISPKKKKRFFRWKSLLLFFNKPTTTSTKRRLTSSTKPLPPEKCEYERFGYATRKCVDEYDFAKMKILTPPLKSSWYLFMFGLARRSPKEVNLSDINRRTSQNKTSKNNPTPTTMFGHPDVREKGLTSSPGRHHARSVVKSVVGCISRA